MTDAKPAIVFDLDGVIVDTCRLKSLLFSGLFAKGFPADEVKRVYEEVKNENGGQDPEELARRICGDDGVSQKRFLQIWHEKNKQIIELTAPGILERISDLRSQAFCIILLTAGRPHVQREKVENCAVTSGENGTFGRIIYVAEDSKGVNKMGEIQKLIAEFGTVIALDDQVYNIELFVTHPRILPVFVRIFPDPRNADYVPPPGVPTITSPDQLTPAFFLNLVFAHTARSSDV